VIDQVSQVHVTSADQGESGGKHNTVSWTLSSPG
jgi:hypothetical protein